MPCKLKCVTFPGVEEITRYLCLTSYVFCIKGVFKYRQIDSEITFMWNSYENIHVKLAWKQYFTWNAQKVHMTFFTWITLLLLNPHGNITVNLTFLIFAFPCSYEQHKIILIVGYWIDCPCSDHELSVLWFLISLYFSLEDGVTQRPNAENRRKFGPLWIPFVYHYQI